MIYLINGCLNSLLIPHANFYIRGHKQLCCCCQSNDILMFTKKPHRHIVWPFAVCPSPRIILLCYSFVAIILHPTRLDPELKTWSNILKCEAQHKGPKPELHSLIDAILGLVGAGVLSYKESQIS